MVYPAGSGADKGSYLTVSLKLVDYQRVSPKKPVYAEFKLKVPNQHSRNKAGVEQTSQYFSTSYFILRFLILILIIFFLKFGFLLSLEQELT